MIALSVPAPVQAVAIVAAIVMLFWWSRRVEPHWVSKDATRFTAKVQHLDEVGRHESHWREVKASIDGQTVRLLARGLGRRIQPFTAYTVDHRATTDTAGKAVFLLVDERGGDYLAIRIPSNSAAVRSLEALVAEP
jgi:hypothetical protein